MSHCFWAACRGLDTWESRFRWTTLRVFDIFTWVSEGLFPWGVQQQNKQHSNYPYTLIQQLTKMTDVVSCI